MSTFTDGVWKIGIRAFEGDWICAVKDGKPAGCICQTILNPSDAKLIAFTPILYKFVKRLADDKNVNIDQVREFAKCVIRDIDVEEKDGDELYGCEQPEVSYIRPQILGTL